MSTFLFSFFLFLNKKRKLIFMILINYVNELFTPRPTYLLFTYIPLDLYILVSISLVTEGTFLHKRDQTKIINFVRIVRKIRR